MKEIYTLITLLLLSVSAYSQTTDWSTDIAAIIYENCTGCHRPGEIGPFPLTTYQEAYDNALSIQIAVNSKLMPPWSPNEDYVHYTGEKILTDDEINLINEWVDGGAIEGDPYSAPPLPLFPEGSQLGTPDLILEMSQSYTTPGTGEDDYHIFVLPSNLTEDKFISAVEFRPGNGAAVHHAIIYVDTLGKGQQKDDNDPSYGYAAIGGSIGFSAQAIGGWVPGNQSVMLPEGIAQKIYKDCDIILEMHFAPSDIPMSDQSIINIFYADDPDPRIIKADNVNELNITNGWLYIQANTTKTFYSEKDISSDISLVAVQPHMHLLGQSMKAFAVPPSGDTIRIIDCDYDFHWQNEYMYQKLLPIPSGSTIYMTSVYDNTTNNPDNPNNPPVGVGWGIHTTDEMQILFYSYLDYQNGDEDIILDSTLMSTSIEQLQSNLLLAEIYPNATHDKLNIVLTQFESAEYYLRDACGRVVRSGAIASHEEEITLNELADGIYFLEIRAGEFHSVRKVVKGD